MTSGTNAKQKYFQTFFVHIQSKHRHLICSKSCTRSSSTVKSFYPSEILMKVSRGASWHQWRVFTAKQLLCI